ncbi:MAG: aminotransferase class I/II-fold pyridoxal phosphate-dependent enzyme [Oscillospiraceae bacterium]
MLDNLFNIDKKLLHLDALTLDFCKNQFYEIEKIKEFNQLKVLKAFNDNKVSDIHFNETTGYGYADIGRDNLDKVFAQIVGAQDSLVRHNFVCGTHALTVALFGVLRPNDIMTCVTGTPYDTMQGVIGINENKQGSLKNFNILYQQVDLLKNGNPDYEEIKKVSLTSKLIYIQRSRGYSDRPSLTIETISKISKVAKDANPNVIVFVDNCYGEFVEEKEPTQVGVDLMAGSLIKNPGGGIAKTGGYIAGRKDLIELCSYRLTTPGTGRDVGCTLGNNRSLYMGLFFAPNVTGDAVKTSVYTTCLYEQLGFNITPKYTEKRTDIISAIMLGTKERLISFCRGIQKGSPVDGFVTPEPGPMPGYDCDVIMAAGAFHMGASIELSADAPLREPFSVWVQGGLTFYSAKIGILLSAQKLLEDNLLNI